MSDVSGIVEVFECGMRRANALLAADYRLLEVLPIAYMQKREVEGEKPIWYVRRDARYIVGRTAEQPSFDGFFAVRANPE